MKEISTEVSSDNAGMTKRVTGNAGSLMLSEGGVGTATRGTALAVGASVAIAVAVGIGVSVGDMVAVGKGTLGTTRAVIVDVGKACSTTVSCVAVTNVTGVAAFNGNIDEFCGCPQAESAIENSSHAQLNLFLILTFVFFIGAIILLKNELRNKRTL